MVEGKHIVIGITGGIAAYKVANLVSKLKKEGAHVHVVMTKNAMEFITPLTFETLSVNKVVTDTFERVGSFEVEHVSLAKQADLILVAPASANMIAKAANGIADDFLSTLLLAARCEVAFAPAMNTAMLNHAATQHNIERLQNRGCYFIAPGSGMLACGDLGDGRMAEPEEMFSWIDDYFAGERDMAGAKVLVTAGPTREKIDEVRYLTNRSSGKMGAEIASAAARRGADVTLVSGAKGISVHPDVNLVEVESAADMYTACMDVFGMANIVIKAAAVADYTPKNVRRGKMKKGEDFVLELQRTKDILFEMGKHKRQGQVLIGFAAEYDDLEANAKDKLARKNLDAIMGNDISREDIGFGSNENEISAYFADGSKRMLDRAGKSAIAGEVLNIAMELYSRKY